MIMWPEPTPEPMPTIIPVPSPSPTNMPAGSEEGARGRHAARAAPDSPAGLPRIPPPTLLIREVPTNNHTLAMQAAAPRFPLRMFTCAHALAGAGGDALCVMKDTEL